MVPQSRFWAVAALAATFVAGGLCGWVAGARLNPMRGQWGSRAPGPEGMLRVLDHELDLTPAQRDSVRAILERHRPDMQRLWAAVHPRFDSLRAVIDTEIASQLTAAQRARYATLAHRRERHGRWQRGSPAPPP